MRYGVGIARRGWLEEKDILNTYTYKELLKQLRMKSGRISPPIKF
jgi:DNA polymerase (family 10)